MPNRLARFLIVAAAEGVIGGVAFAGVVVLAEPGELRNAVLLAIWPLVIVCGTIVALVWIVQGENGHGSGRNGDEREVADALEKGQESGSKRYDRREVTAALRLIANLGSLRPEAIELIRVIAAEKKHLYQREVGELKRYGEVSTAFDELAAKGLVVQAEGRVHGSEEPIPVYYLSTYADRVELALALLDVRYPDAHRTIERQLAPTGYFSRDALGQPKRPVERSSRPPEAPVA